MRTLVTLAALIVGLTVVFWTPVANAHCPHGNSTTNDHCPSEPPSPPGATLGDLSCNGGEIAKYDGAAWNCAADEDTTIPDTDTDTLADLAGSEDQIARFNGIDWECVTGGGDVNFVLMDCADLACGRDPQQVGTVVGLTGLSGVLVLLIIPDSLGQPRNIVLQVTRAKIQNAGSGVWFDDVDCSELANAWIRLEPGDVGSANGSSGLFFPPAIEDYSIVSDTADDTVRSLWVVTDDTIFDGISVSKAEGEGCNPGVQAFSGVPAEKIANDLHSDFPPPYTLEIQ